MYTFSPPSRAAHQPKWEWLRQEKHGIGGSFRKKRSFCTDLPWKYANFRLGLAGWNGILPRGLSQPISSTWGVEGGWKNMSFYCSHNAVFHTTGWLNVGIHGKCVPLADSCRNRCHRWWLHLPSHLPRAASHRRTKCDLIAEQVHDLFIGTIE